MKGSEIEGKEEEGREEGEREKKRERKKEREMEVFHPLGSLFLQKLTILGRQANARSPEN